MSDERPVAAASTRRHHHEVSDRLSGAPMRFFELDAMEEALRCLAGGSGGTS